MNILLSKQIYLNVSIRFGFLEFEFYWNAEFEQETISL